MKVLLVGISTRALAVSAATAGYDVVSLDYFGDSDQPTGMKSFSLERDFQLPVSPRGLKEAAGGLIDTVDAVCFCAGVENEPEMAGIIGGRKRLGNSPESIRLVRDPEFLAKVLKGSGVSYPVTIKSNEVLPDIRDNKSKRWLVKDLRQSGGWGVTEWDGTPIGHDHIMQEYISGPKISAVFLSDGKKSHILGLTLLLAGVSRFGAKPYWWSGNIAPFQHRTLHETISSAVQTLTRSCGLIGINGVDFVVRKGRPYLLEVNPRYTGSVDLLEEIFGWNAFELHFRACQGKAPSFNTHPIIPYTAGKGILYAQEDCLIYKTDQWQEQGIQDIPQPGTFLSAGDPICTITSKGASILDCWHRLLEKAHYFKKSMI